MPTHPCELIKNAAIAGDLPALKAIIYEQSSSSWRLWNPRTHVSIDVWSPKYPFLSPAGELAYEGNDTAVDFLLKNGANPYRAAEGYAMRGNLEKVENLRSRYSLNHHMISKAFAMAGNKQQVFRYEKEFHTSIHQNAMGYAMKGDFVEVERYFIEEKANIHDIAYGLALGGYFGELEKYRIKGAKVKFITEALAIAGYYDEAYRYCTQHGAKTSSMVRGLAAAGRTDQIEKLEKTLAIKIISTSEYYDGLKFGYALGGHIELARGLLGPWIVNVKTLDLPRSQGGHISATNEDGKNCHVTWGYARAGYHPRFLLQKDSDQGDGWTNIGRVYANFGYAAEAGICCAQYGADPQPIAKVLRDSGYTKDAQKFEKEHLSKLGLKNGKFD